MAMVLSNWRKDEKKEGWAHHKTKSKVRQVKIPSMIIHKCRISYIFRFCWTGVFSASEIIILLLENNSIPVNKLNIVTYPKAMPINEHAIPMRISMANISLPPVMLIFIIYDGNHS